MPENNGPPDCPDCGKKLTPGNVTVDGSKGPITPPDAISLLVNTEDEMINVVLRCNNCGFSLARTITVRSIN